MVLQECSGKLYQKKDWPSDEDYLESIKEQWVEPFGDMTPVFIGQNLDKEKILERLDECLLTEDEVLRGKLIDDSQDPFRLGIKFNNKFL